MKIRSAVVCLTLLLPGLQAEGSWAQRTQSPTVSPKVPSAQTVNQNARPNVQAFNFKPTITVSNPAGGTIPLDGKGLYVTFSAKNFDISRNGQIKFIGELLLNGTAMGVTSNPNVPFVLNLNQPAESLSVIAGDYITLPGFQDKVATPGGGYQYRITAFTGDWQKSPTVVAKGESSSFSFGARTVPSGNPVVSVQSPKGGEAFPLDGKGIYVTFTAKNFDIYQNGKIKFIGELLHDGTALGVTSNPNVPFTLNLNVASESLSVTSGEYIVLPAFQDKVATSGGGYQYRITAFTGDWQKSPSILASAVSGTFTFGSRIFPTGPASISVQTPKAGESYGLDNKGIYVTFTAKNFDIYQNGKIKFIGELLRNGAALGVTSNPNVAFTLNLNTPSESLSVIAGQYIMLPAFQEKMASAGGGYQYRITAFTGDWQKVPTILTSGISGTFTLGTKVQVIVPPKVTLPTNH